MGAGDDVIATGLAGAAQSKKKVAFGDGLRILWGPFSEEIFRHNPKIARPGERGDLHWINYYKGHRIYNKAGAGRWIWNYEFAVTPGELYFHPGEMLRSPHENFILIEPNLPWHKPITINKDWGEAKFQALADRLLRDGEDVVQFSHGKRRLKGVRVIETSTFRHALITMRGARIAVLPEGGLHHGAAALGIPAIVLFGGCVPPRVLGYDDHINLTGGAGEACGSVYRCDHCQRAMAQISVDEVYEHVHSSQLSAQAAAKSAGVG